MVLGKCRGKKIDIILIQILKSQGKVITAFLPFHVMRCEISQKHHIWQ